MKSLCQQKGQFSTPNVAPSVRRKGKETEAGLTVILLKCLWMLLEKRSIYTEPDIRAFRKLLKTHLFNLAFNVH